MPLTDTPLVSVIMPCFNDAAFIGEAIQSILAQDYRNREIIVVDDGSTDNSIDVIRSFGSDVILLTQENAGSAIARNFALQQASGELIAFLDSDDAWLPGKLRTQVNFLKTNPGIGACFTAFHHWWPDGDGLYPDVASFPLPEKEGPKKNATIEWCYPDLLLKFPFWTGTALIPRTVIEKAGPFNPELRVGQDYDLWIRIATKYKIAFLDLKTALYRKNPTSNTKWFHKKNYRALIVENALERFGKTGADGKTINEEALALKLSSLWQSYARGAIQAGERGIAVMALDKAISYRKNAKLFAVNMGCRIPVIFRLFHAYLKHKIGALPVRNY